MRVNTHCFLGADDEARTRYLHLGKVALYQMSYIRTLVPPVRYLFYPLDRSYYTLTEQIMITLAMVCIVSYYDCIVNHK